MRRAAGNGPAAPRRRAARGFTLVEVLVALMVVALGLAALMTTVAGTARTSGYLRDKTLAQWIALNRMTEVRLNQSKFGQNLDTGELQFANRTWHYDTRYFNTSIATMKRVVVRVWAGKANTKSNPVVETTGFLGGALGIPGASNVDWTQGSTVAPATPGAGGAPGRAARPGGAPPTGGATLGGPGAPTAPATPAPVTP